MAALHLYCGNRLEILAEALACVVESTPKQPLDKDVILVQSKGMESWLSLYMARRFGIWANFEFPFPNTLIDGLIGAAVGAEQERDPFDRERMTLRIQALLPELLDDPRFRPLNRFLESGAKELKCYQLARRLAHLFDQYAVYRPELLLSWEEGKEADWQAELWRYLAATAATGHRARRHREFLRRCAAGSVTKEVFPAAIHLFGVSALPPYHIDVLVAAAVFCRVNLFLLNPCREYWFDIRSPKEISRRHTVCAGVPEDFSTFHFEVGHPLLASWGRSGRDFFETIWEKGEPQEENLFAEAPGKTLLATLQNDILHLRDRCAAEEKTPVDPCDRSLEIHSCHTPLREIEALHDYLLACFRDEPSLPPGDILVMAPDIGVYAPYIAAVFGAAPDSSRRIPFAVADLSRKKENRLAAHFFSLLALRHGRRTAHQILDLADCPEIMARFQFHGTDLERIAFWIEELRIRWGLDGTDRSRFGVPPFQDNSWRAGLDRLLLGYALAADNQLFADILPAVGIEGESAQIAGRLAEFIAAIDEFLAEIEKSRSLCQWGEFFQSLLGRFFDPGIDADGNFFALGEVFRSLADLAASSGFDRPVAVDVAEAWLEDRIEAAFSPAGRFLAGGVTFAALLPMRSIPFKVVALIGMNDGSFPRSVAPAEFDRIAAAPRRGDRSLRQEDRYLFLETLLSARNRLYISFLGQSVRDNSPLPPSVLVDELMDYLQQGFAFGAKEIFIRHRLQAFHPSCFVPETPTASFSEENFRAAAASLEGHRADDLTRQPLPPPDEHWKEVDLSQLIRFFHHPAAFFCEQRLGLTFRALPNSVEEREPFGLSSLDRFFLGEELTEAVLAGAEPQTLYPRVRAEGRLPGGAGGRIVFTDLALEAKRFAAAIGAAAPEERRPQETFSLTIGAFKIVGSLPKIHGGKAIHHRFARLRGKDLLTVWLHRLVADALENKPAPQGSLLFHRDGGCRLRPAETPFPLLTNLLDLFWNGLSSPLPFFPDTSLAYAAELTANPENRRKALQSARESWQGNAYQDGEREDPCRRYCFGATDPLDEEFEGLAMEVFAPLLAHQEKIT